MAGHTGRVVRCSAWAPSAPWAAAGRAGFSLDGRAHQPRWDHSPRPTWRMAYLLVGG